MVGMIVFVSLFLGVLGILIMSTWKPSANDLQQKYIIRGLCLAVFLVGAFIAGSWLIDAFFAMVLDAGYATLGKWMIVVFIIFMFFEQSQRRKQVQEYPLAVNARVISQLPTLKIQGMGKVIVGDFRKRY